MRRLLFSLLIVVLAAISSTAFAQSQETTKPLGDVAREVRQAPKKPSARVFTDDTLQKPAATDSEAKSAEVKSSEVKSKPKAKEVAVQNGDDEDAEDVTPEPVEPTRKTEVKPAEKAEATEAKAKKEEPSVDNAQLAKDWKQRVAAQHGVIDLIEREISVSEREYKLRASSYYADAGLRLRNDQQWIADDKKFNAEMETKKQKLSKAKEDLDQMINEARRAGVNGID